MSEISIHDNQITGYTVNCQERTIVFHTTFKDHPPEENTDVTFEGVEAYQIVGDNMHSIILSIDEVSIPQIFQDYAADFKEGIKYAWPGSWNTSPSACQEHLEKSHCKGWLISTSYGMGGFIMARGMEFVSRQTG